MERSAGRSGAPVPHILGKRLLRRLDEYMGLVRAEGEVQIEFQQLVNEPRDLTAASMARFDPERAQERQFERPSSAKSDAARSGSRTEARYSSSRVLEPFHVRILPFVRNAGLRSGKGN
jgi:hypothetical protein